MRHDRIKAFYEEHRHKLYTYALSLTGCPATAEDAVHTAICKLLDTRILPQKLKPYAYRCTRNAAIDNWRKHAARCETITDELQQTTAPGHKLVNHDLETLLCMLTLDERETVMLKALHGFTFREIAAGSKTSINTVASRYRRGLQKLKTLCEEDTHEQH